MANTVGPTPQNINWGNLVLDGPGFTEIDVAIPESINENLMRETQRIVNDISASQMNAGARLVSSAFGTLMPDFDRPAFLRRINRSIVLEAGRRIDELQTSPIAVTTREVVFIILSEMSARDRFAHDLLRAMMNHYEIVFDRIVDAVDVFRNRNSMEPADIRGLIYDNVSHICSDGASLDNFLNNFIEIIESQSPINYSAPQRKPDIIIKTSIIREQKDFKKQYKENPIAHLLKAVAESKTLSKAVNYAISFSEKTRVDITNWDLLEILTDKKTDEIVTEKREINKRMISTRLPTELLDGAKETKPERKEIDISKLAGVQFQSIVQAARVKMTESQVEYEKAFKKMMRLREIFIPFQEAYIALSQKDAKGDGEYIKNQLQEIQDNGIFEVVKYDPPSHTFSFKNVYPFIINLEKKFQRHGVTKIELGHFNISLNFQTFDTYIYSTEENQRVAPFTNPGPFVHSYSLPKLCYGHEVKKLDGFRQTKDLVSTMRLIYDVMTQYTTGVTPHRQIEYFVDEQRVVNAYRLSGIMEYFKDGIVPARVKKPMKHAYFEVSNMIRSNEYRVQYCFFTNQFVNTSRQPSTDCIFCSDALNSCSCDEASGSRSDECEDEELEDNGQDF